MGKSKRAKLTEADYERITSLTLDNDQIADIYVLLLCTNLKQLTLKNTQIKKLTALTKLKSLRTLVLINNPYLIGRKEPHKGGTYLQWPAEVRNLERSLPGCTIYDENSFKKAREKAAREKAAREKAAAKAKEEARKRAARERAADKAAATNKFKIEAAIQNHFSVKKPTGELTKADYEKVPGLVLSNKQLTSVKGLEKLTKLTGLLLDNNQLTDVKGLEKFTQLTRLYLKENPALTKAQIAELQKALPKCGIFSNPKKLISTPQKIGGVV